MSFQSLRCCGASETSLSGDTVTHPRPTSPIGPGVGQPFTTHLTPTHKVPQAATGAQIKSNRCRDASLLRLSFGMSQPTLRRCLVLRHRLQQVLTRQRGSEQDPILTLLFPMGIFIFFATSYPATGLEPSLPIFHVMCPTRHLPTMSHMLSCILLCVSSKHHATPSLPPRSVQPCGHLSVLWAGRERDT